MLQENQQNIQIEKFSRIIPIWKFILLSVITFGIYEVIWFYRNWKLLKNETGLKITPLLRALFAPIFAGSLAWYLEKYLKEKDILCKFSPTFIGIYYFIIVILWKLPDPYSLLSLFTFMPLLPLVNSLNKYWQKEEQNLAPKKFTWWQIILIILGVFLVLLFIFASFLPE